MPDSTAAVATHNRGRSSVVDQILERSGILAPILRKKEPIAAREKEFEVIKLTSFAGLGEAERDVLRDRTVACIEDRKPNGRKYRWIGGQLMPDAKKELRRRLKWGEAVHFLDVGPGKGGGLKAAMNLSKSMGLPQNLFVYGWGLGRLSPEIESEIPKGHFVRRHFETAVFRMRGGNDGPFDVAQSLHGLEHAANKPLALKNVLNSLATDGKLFNFPPLFASEKGTFPERYAGPFYKTLTDQGFAVKRSERIWEPEIFVRGEGALADLSRFYPNKRMSDVPLPKEGTR